MRVSFGVHLPHGQGLASMEREARLDDAEREALRVLKEAQEPGVLSAYSRGTHPETEKGPRPK